MTQLVIALLIVAVAAGILARRAWRSVHAFFTPPAPAPKPAAPAGFHAPEGCGGCPLSQNCSKK